MTTRKSVAWTLALGLLGGTQAMAQVNPNGFPSGPHFTLNLLAKKDSYACTPLELDPISGDPLYGNVIYIPESGEGIEILMTSGKGKRAAVTTELRVMDACAGFDGDAAEIQLPPNDKGYRVYARALGKPTDGQLQITPGLVTVEDDKGEDLIYLGLVNSHGFAKPDETLTRPKGKTTAVDITGLFQWSGDVCAISWEGDFTGTVDLCVLDNPVDGVIGELDPADQLFPPVDDGTGFPSCKDGEGSLTTVAVNCTTYSDTWVFNISEFVTYLWDVNNSGVKLMQVRFYPNE